MARLKDCTLLKVELETGRTHQIRVHMASIGRPLCGDTVYGRGKPRFGLAGQALHGYALTFVHPASGERLTFYAPIPEYFMDALEIAYAASPKLDNGPGFNGLPQGQGASTKKDACSPRFFMDRLAQNGEALLDFLKQMPQRRKENQL